MDAFWIFRLAMLLTYINYTLSLHDCDDSSNYLLIDMLIRSPCSLNFSNLCDNFVNKLLVSEIRKCRQLQGDFVPLTPLTRVFALDLSGTPPPHPRHLASS